MSSFVIFFAVLALVLYSQNSAHIENIAKDREFVDRAIITDSSGNFAANLRHFSNAEFDYVCFFGPYSFGANPEYSAPVYGITEDLESSILEVEDRFFPVPDSMSLLLFFDGGAELLGYQNFHQFKGEIRWGGRGVGSSSAFCTAKEDLIVSVKREKNVHVLLFETER